ncbi:MAG: hypothetical protein HYY06_16785 [Deltaproteobacteria bacterium]|nr:hypothetical protein [Deltaproteobacteria bacterium]
MPSARDIALWALGRVERDGAFASAALASAFSRDPSLDPRDRGLATELTMGVLRWRGALDAAIAACAPRGIRRLDSSVLSALRIAAYQIAHLDRVPPAAAISAAVDQVRAARGDRMAGFASGVLRALERGEHGALALARDLGLSHPAWLVDVLGRRLPADEVDLALAVNNSPPPTCLRVNVRRATPDAVAELLTEKAPGVSVSHGRHVSTCLRVEGLGDPAANEAHRLGWYSVQDEGAQIVVALCVESVCHKKGVRALDACAGRGGKTAALAEALEPGSAIEAADRSPQKLERLAADFARLGLPPARAIAVDLEVGTAGLVPGYDLILLDAPCSGTGVVRRRPDIRWRRSRADVLRMADVQAVLLQKVAPLLEPGGVLVYSVCSITEEEGPGVVRRAPASLRLVSERTLWPHRDDTDGFFIATLEDSRLH